MTALCDLAATEAAARIATGEIGAEDLMRACLARIAEREGEVQAFTFIDADRALVEARRADAVRREGKGVGPLHGVPVAIKDIIDTADMPTEHGSPVFAGRRPAKDAQCVTALRDAGAIILGKTVTTELATLTPGKTRNPHNPRHTPGGSSSGSAAGLAAGFFPLALATQTGGSVIRPASFCGICGMKPTFGLISRTGVLLQSHTLDTVGVYGRSVEDLALAVDALSAQDASDPASYPRSRPDHRPIAMSDVPVPPLFAFVKTPAWEEHGDPRMHAAFAELVEALGKQVEEIPIASLERATAWAKIVQGAENLAYYGPLLEQAPDKISKGLTDRLVGAKAIDARSYITAIRGRETAYAVIEEVLTNYTAILTPAAAGPAPEGLGSTGNPVFNAPWTYLGVPCVTLPLLEVDGLPLGVQLVGLRRDDGRLLRTARWLEGFVRALDS
jgi:Asp-tRNA(Asn)/Glu-tRNA(Gln) amidotransferase A subunit family amidase